MKTCLPIFFFLIASLAFATDDLVPNYWASCPDGCTEHVLIDAQNQTTEVSLACNGQVTKLLLDFPIVSGFVDPIPASASAFALEKSNLNYLTNPDKKLHVHMVMRGNDQLSVDITAQDFKWNEQFSINLQEESACIVGTICQDFVTGNQNMTILETYFLNHPEIHPYMQELVNKIIEAKDKAPDMAKAAAIVMKSWMQSSLNPKAFYSSGLVFRSVWLYHCRSAECWVTKRRADGTLTTEHSYYCQITMTDP